jgi:hypothetical protein
MLILLMILKIIDPPVVHIWMCGTDQSVESIS